jgi:hypothetical protein
LLYFSTCFDSIKKTERIYLSKGGMMMLQDTVDSILMTAANAIERR